MNKYFFSASFLLLSMFSQAQEYFQQKVNYNIHVKLNDVKNELSASETIEYINNSPDDLTFIYFHLWANAYRDNSTALAKQLLEDGNKIMYYAKDDELGYIDSLDFKVNGDKINWEFVKDSIDICKLYLNKPLLSGEKITITTPFHIKLPSGKISRMGHIGQSYQISQWYPKPAVYDRNGWNYMPYLTQGEFYSEFGSFDVSITIPANYVLGATGDREENESETKFLNQKIAETQAITTFNSKDMDFPKSDSVLKTIRFIQTNVHDFAWFCDKRYHVLKGETVTPHTNHQVTTWAMFTNAEGNLWKNSINYINDAIHFYSLWNGDYPYNNCTAVDGTISAGGGMEYPNITVIGTSGHAFMLDVVITHEVGHNWFYGMLGNNERAHAWMDEGMNSFNECRYVKTKYPNQKLIGGFADKAFGKIFDMNRYKKKWEYDLSYLFSASKNEDQPIELPAYKYTQMNYAGDVYSKTAIVFDYLMAYLGEEEMDKAMQRYFELWHFKHPMPADFRKVMEESTGKDLSWFFNDFINSSEKLDYEITSAKHNRKDGTWKIGVENTGKINSPLIVNAIKDRKIVSTKIYEGFQGSAKLEFPNCEADRFKIDSRENMPEINRNNNLIRTKGLFKKVEPIKFQWLASLDNPDKTQLFYTPVAGWNEYNKGMLGLSVYNSVFPEKKFEFCLTPLWSFARKDLTGYFIITFNHIPNGRKLFQKVSVSIKAARFGYSNIPFAMNYNKIAPEITFHFKKKNLRNPISQSLQFRSVNIIQDFYKGNYDFTPPIYFRDTLVFNYTLITYNFSRSDIITPFDFKLELQNSVDFTKLSGTFNYSYNFKNKNKGIDFRLFAGTFIGDNNADNDVRFRLSGWRGYHDYMYDNIYFGRSERDGIMAAQMSEHDGAFKFYSYVGQTSKWLVALNVKSSLGNAKVPINVYADIGITEYDGRDKDKFLYDAGICISLPKNIFEIYFPILLCNDFKNYVKLNTNSYYEETIRFTLNLNLLNPFELREKVQF